MLEKLRDNSCHCFCSLTFGPSGAYTPAGAFAHIGGKHSGHYKHSYFLSLLLPFSLLSPMVTFLYLTLLNPKMFLTKNIFESFFPRFKFYI
jgi:hypothetical protein